MDQYADVPPVHDSKLVALRITRTPQSLSLVLEMLEFATYQRISVSFPSILWMSTNLIGELIVGEYTVDEIAEWPIEEIPERYRGIGGRLFRISLHGGSTVQVVSQPPILTRS